MSFTTVREGEYAVLPFARRATNGLTSWNNEFVSEIERNHCLSGYSESYLNSTYFECRQYAGGQE